MASVTRSSVTGTHPVFLLEVTWSGRTYYLSTSPISLQGTHGKTHFQGGLLEDPAFETSLPDIGFRVSSFSTPVAAVFIGVNIAQQQARGNFLDDAEAELSYVMVSNEKTPTYEQRAQVLKGKIVQPVYGHADQPAGYCEFSIESNVLDSSLYALVTGFGAEMTVQALSARLNVAVSPFAAFFTGSTTKLSVSDVNKGKKMPIIFGEAGKITDDSLQTQYYAASPAYVIHASGVNPKPVYLGIAAHRVAATKVRIFDNKGSFGLVDVNHWIRNGSQPFAYVNFNLATLHLADITADESVEYYASWNNGGGVISPSSPEGITGGGDICLYCLERGQNDIDFVAWQGLRSILNRYRFAGYINNEEISPIEFIQNEIIPLLPISVVHGNEGIKPVYNLKADGAGFFVRTAITASSDFQLTGSVATQTDINSIYNDITLKYAYDVRVEQYQASMRLTGSIDAAASTASVYSSQAARLSALKYGVRPRKIESTLIHEPDTAARVLRDAIALQSIPQKRVQYACSPRFGYLEVGDIIELTDSTIGLSRTLAQVVSKSYDSAGWLLSMILKEEVFV